MADQYTWTLSDIRSRFRNLTGLSQTADISDANVNKAINDYYQHYFPQDANLSLDLLKTFFTQSTSVTDSGQYTLNQTDIKLSAPVFKNEDEITIIQDPKRFFAEYPDDEQYITSPTLAIGSDTTKVGYSAFTYRVGGYSYSASASEITLSGDTVPQNKYGAFGFKIDDDGDITIVEADDNATGYDTPAKAVEDLADADDSSAYMGYITVISTDAGGFVPGTTALDDSAVTDTYTNGDPGDRGIPEAVCIYGGSLYVRPRADDIYQLKLLEDSRPSAFADDASVPSDVKWGPAIASGAAILYAKQVMKDQELVNEIHPIWKYFINSIKDKYVTQLMERHIQRSF